MPELGAQSCGSYTDSAEPGQIMLSQVVDHGQMYCRFWIVNQVNPALLGELLGGAGTGPASYLLGMQQKGELSLEGVVASTASLQRLVRQLSMFLMYCAHTY